MTLVERVLLEVNMPDFITRFKNVCLNQLLTITDQALIQFNSLVIQLSLSFLLLCLCS